MIDQNLVNKIKDELREDLSRYDDEYDVWSEVVLDCPSNTLDDILSQISEDDIEECYLIIGTHVRSLKP